MFFRLFSWLTVTLWLTPALAADSAIVLDTAEQHLRLQTKGSPGTVTITMGQFDASRLPPCTTHEAFTPKGSRMIGKTNVGVRCLSPNAWTVLVPAQIAVTGTYVTTSRALIAGQIIQAGDLISASGNLSNLPTGAISDPAAAIGRIMKNSIGVGQALRANQLLAPLVIKQGQTVRVISSGAGFSVSAEGKAVNNASAGDLVRVRMESGQIVSGKARADGIVEISF
ncbi:MAG: flagellar basal body P-ring formation chaperone FlgA [Rhodocyclaceae bacterium]|nr:flagellar basal body P-ring formation chaperone FlgA [Rhodocyclaceae bacterium]